jgi:hypothetical protein
MSRIYDSSAITQRRRDQAQAGSFINRIQNPNNPQTSYGPLQGNYDASIMNSVKMGQPKEFYRNSGCIIISNGCPCPPIAVDEIVSGPTPPVILAPGSVSNITVEYGSVIVTWNAPTEGGAPTSYTLFADDQTNSANSVTITGITTPSYSFATLDLRSGDEYQMSVIGVNAAGNGSPPTSLPLPISAPYIAPISTTTSSEFFPNRIVITLTPYTVFTPTKYILKTYINDAFSSTSSSTDYSPDLIIVNTNLSCLNVYSFQVQLLNNTQYSSFGIKGTNVPVYPYGPNFLPPPNDVTNITTTTAQVNYADYTIEGFDLTTGNAECILNSVPAIGYSSLTNTSVTLTNLIPGREYTPRSITISFRKTIQGNVITSPPLSLPSFMTNNIIPGSVSNVLAIYGTTVTNVTWDAPTTGGTVASYTLFADDQTNSANSVTITGITDISYIFNTGSLTAGDEYLFRVTAVNSAGSGTAGVSSSFYAPYIVASDVSAQALITNPNTIFINYSPYEFGIGLPPTQYTLIQYTNGTYTTTTTELYGTNQIAISSGLNATDLYSFQFQLSRPANNKYTSYTPLTTPTRIYPAGPTIISYSDYSTTSVKIKYENFLTDGYDLTGATCTITNVTTTLTIQAGSLTNRSVIVEGLSPATPYANYTISFSKSPYNNSAASSLTTFYTYGEALSNVRYSSDGTNPTTTHIQCNYSNYTVTGGFSLDPPASIVATDGSTALNYANITNTTFTFTDLTPGRIYNNVQITLYNSPYRSVTFTLTPFTTSSEAPTRFAHGNLADIPVPFTFDTYTPFTSGITAITFYATKNNTDSVTISGTVVSDQSMTISLDPDASYTYAYIIIYNGLITSLPSNEITFRTPYPNPTITVTSTKTCRTQELEFSYSTTYFTPTGVAIVAPSGVTVSALSASNPYYVTLENLTPDTTYSTIKIQLTGNSGESSQYTTISPFTTLSVTTGGNINNLNVGIVTTNSIQMRFDPFGGFGTSGGNPTGAIVTTSNGVVILPQNIELIVTDNNYTGITITGLAQGQELSNPTITLTNDANCLQSNPATYGNTIKTYYAAPTGLVVSYITQTTATIDFTFSSFQPSTNNTYVTRAGFSDLTVLTVTESFVTITGLTTGTTYSDYQLQLGNSIGQTTEPTTIPPFTQWPAPDVNAAGIYTGTDYVRIPYSQYTAFYPSGGILYTNNGSFSSVFSITDYYIEINGLSSGEQYDNCYITLTDGINTSYPSYPTYPYFSFTTQGSPPPPSYPAPDVNASGIYTGTDYVTIPYSTYSAFSPSNVSSGTLYTNNGSFSNVSSISNTEMTVSGLSPGQYDNCYITLTDNSNTSDPSHPTYPYFSFTIQSSPPPPSYPAPDVNASAISTGTDYVTIPYSTYTAFSPFNVSSGTLYVNGSQTGSVSSISNTEMTVSVLSPGQYDNCYITLTDGSNTSDPSYPTYSYFSFTIQSSPPPPSYPAPDVNAAGIYTGTDYVRIPYSQYTTFYPSGGTLYTNNGSFSSFSSITDYHIEINGLSSGTQYDNCYIILTDGSNTSDPSYPTYQHFSFTTQNPSPSYPAPDVNASAISTGTDYVTIPYSQYNALSLSSGTLYVNGAQTGNVSSIYNTEMTVSMLSSGTLYDSCYITLTDGSNTSDPSTYFSFTTVPNAPSAIQLQPYAYYTQDIIFDSYTAPLTGAIISDGGSGVYGYTNLTQSSLTITGLRPGYGYSLSVQVVNAGGTSSSSSISYFTTNYPPPNPNVTTIVGDFDSNTGTATISVFFDSYLSEFIPVSGTLYDSNTMPLGSYNSVSSTSLVVTGVSTDNYYANCYITLYNGTDTTPQSNPFNVGTTPVTGAGQITTAIDPYANPIRIGYNNVGGFNPFNASTGTIYVPNYGNWSGTAVSQQGGDNFADFTLPITGTYDNCYIVLFDTTGKSTLSSNTFTITVT